MRSRPFTVRLDLPGGWYQLGRDDPDAWMAEFAGTALYGATAAERDAALDELLDTYGLADVIGAVDALVHLPDGDTAIRAVLVCSSSDRRSFLRRGVAAHAAPLVRDLRRSGADRVDVVPAELPSGPAVRLHAVAGDELGRPAEQVRHVVLPPRSPGAVVLRTQWRPGRADAPALARMADRIAHDALVETW